MVNPNPTTMAKPKPENPPMQYKDYLENAKKRGSKTAGEALKELGPRKMFDNWKG